MLLLFILPSRPPIVMAGCTADSDISYVDIYSVYFMGVRRGAAQ